MLDWDIENRPLSYMGMDFTSAEVTAIAWSWVGEDEVSSLLLRRDGKYALSGGRALSPAAAFEFFVSVLYSADIVTGHYILRHDLPIINAACMENGVAPLRPLMVQDTKVHLIRRKDLSASQESLAAMLRLPEPKKSMTQQEWRDANRLTPRGLTLAHKRVSDDVRQHKSLRAELIRRGLLKTPTLWRP